MSQALASRPRVALIGITGYAQIYLDLVREFRARGELTLVAAVIINPAQQPAAVSELRDWGTSIYATCDTFFAREAERIDLCLVPTGIPWHARMTVAALAAGMNVLVEKPLAGSLADAAAIRAAERASGHFVAVGFQDLYVPEVRWLKQHLIDGRIGQLRSIRFLGLWPRPQTYFERNAWAGRLHADDATTNDSPLNNAFAHFVNLCLFLAAPQPERSTWPTVVHADLLRAHAIDSFDTAVVCGRTQEGVGLWLGASHACAENREPEIFIEGSAGHGEWCHGRQCGITPDGGAPQIIPVPGYDGSRAAMFTAVLARLRDPSVFICNTGIAECHTALIDALHQKGAIRTFAPPQITWIPNGTPKSLVPAVRGIEAALVEAFRTRGDLKAFPVA